MVGGWVRIGCCRDCYEFVGTQKLASPWFLCQPANSTAKKIHMFFQRKVKIQSGPLQSGDELLGGISVPPASLTRLVAYRQSGQACFVFMFGFPFVKRPCRWAAART